MYLGSLMDGATVVILLIKREVFDCIEVFSFNILRIRGICNHTEKVLWCRYTRCAKSFILIRKGGYDLAGPII